MFYKAFDKFIWGTSDQFDVFPILHSSFSRNWCSYVKSGFCQELSSDERVADPADLDPDCPLYNMSPGQRLTILSLLLFLLFLSLYHPPIAPVLPSTLCPSLEPLSSLRDLAAVWRHAPMCGVGLSLKTLYKVEEEEAGSLILPKPLLEGWLVYRKGGNKVKTFYNFSTKMKFFTLKGIFFALLC